MRSAALPALLHVQHCTVQYSQSCPLLYCTLLYTAAAYSTVLLRAAQNSTGKHSTRQRSTALERTAEHPTSTVLFTTYSFALCRTAPWCTISCSALWRRTAPDNAAQHSNVQDIAVQCCMVALLLHGAPTLRWYCTVLCCTALHGTALHCTALHCPACTAL
jgi:hypothetical protein